MNNNFKIIFLIIFMIAGIVGILIFSGIIPLGNGGKSNTERGSLVIWGTIRAQVVNNIIQEFSRLNKDISIKYFEKSEATLKNELLEAIVSGAGPDMFFISGDMVLEYKNKIFAVPYKTFPIDSFKNSFAGAGDVFLDEKGVLAFPVAIDPLVMYYNRRLMDSNGVALPPVFWNDFPDVVSKLTKKDEDGVLKKSAVALGQFSNILYAKDILTAMFMQSGSPIIVKKGGKLLSALNSSEQSSSPASVLSFYTDFTNPLSRAYAWNKSMPPSMDAFSKENLGFYFGLASDMKILSGKNPNLNFGISPFPQIKDKDTKITFGRVEGLAISAFSKNPGLAFSVANSFSQGQFAKQLASGFGMAPARRDLLQSPPEEPYIPTIYASALFARSWTDPSSKETDTIFSDMVEKVLSNGASSEQAVGEANSKLGFLLRKY